MSSSECVFELGIEFSETNINVLLMSLMEETQEEYCEDERLVSIIESLEAEINGTEMSQTYEKENVDDRDYSMSASDLDHWVDMKLISSLPFDEMNNWIPYGDEIMEHVAMEYGNAMNDFQFCY
ncbi:hypothetical protein VNO78_13407 [Psophocarpus tetragonolobus]|uniref:Uncharacterized protein n=1 Tax=Psophocarpus tetragonolobus TaxID=3891 RepID=A0AAN9XQ43_PSOTE